MTVKLLIPDSKFQIPNSILFIGIWNLRFGILK